jgi:hypothetical protein
MLSGAIIAALIIVPRTAHDDFCQAAGKRAQNHDMFVRFPRLSELRRWDWGEMHTIWRPRLMAVRPMFPWGVSTGDNDRMFAHSWESQLMTHCEG